VSPASSTPRPSRRSTLGVGSHPGYDLRAFFTAATSLFSGQNVVRGSSNELNVVMGPTASLSFPEEGFQPVRVGGLGAWQSEGSGLFLPALDGIDVWLSRDASDADLVRIAEESEFGPVSGMTWVGTR
jgi:hypothetical protein